MPASRPAVAGTVATLPPCDARAAQQQQPHLDHDLEDGAGADGQGQRRPMRREGVAAEPDAGDRRQAGQRREADEGRQPVPRLDQRCDDADAFGDVVQGEAEDQEGAERRRTGRERRADRQPLAEIVQADAERDGGGEAQPAELAPAPPADGIEQAAVIAATSQTIAAA